MKLITRLKIFAIFALCMVLIIGMIAFFRAVKEDGAIAKSSLAADIVARAFSLTVLTDDFSRTHGKRAEVQWLSQHTYLNASIAKYAATSETERLVLHQLQHQQEVIANHFSSLEEIVHMSQSTDLSRAAIQRLGGQLSVDMQTIVTLASQLAAINNQQVIALRQVTNIFIIMLLIVLITSFILSYTFLDRYISQSVQSLIQGNRRLAEGHLEYRFPVVAHDEFGELAASFNTMTQQLQELDIAKDEFIALAAHELRTPITAVKGYLDMVVKGVFGRVPERIAYALSRGQSAVDLEVKLINDLLDASRVKTGTIPYTMTSFPLDQMVGEVVESFQQTAQQKGIAISLMTGINDFVTADKDWAKQIVSNIIGNAIKFTDKGTIDIAYKIEKKRILVFVKDTGIGIDRKDQEKLFKKFQQISSKETGKPHGSGLGLYISREIARQMGGEVWLESSILGKGSTFVIAFPRIDK